MVFVVPATRSRRTTAGPAAGFAPRLAALERNTTHRPLSETPALALGPFAWFSAEVTEAR